MEESTHYSAEVLLGVRGPRSDRREESDEADQTRTEVAKLSSATLSVTRSDAREGNKHDRFYTRLCARATVTRGGGKRTRAPRIRCRDGCGGKRGMWRRANNVIFWTRGRSHVFGITPNLPALPAHGRTQ